MKALRTKCALAPGGHHGAFGRTFVVYWTLRVETYFNYGIATQLSRRPQRWTSEPVRGSHPAEPRPRNVPVRSSLEY
ncbi:MAG: hypothetical protein JWM43_2830 [Acidobacteriaceae bacterium]|nr:hypothetical protein [Acidobacteriaceae bacterium]